MRKTLRFAITLFFVIILGFFIKPDYYLISPGSAEELGRMIRLEGKTREEDGQFLMVTVAQHQVNIWSLLYGYWHPLMDVRSISRILPPNISREEYNEIMESWMQDSKYLAQIIALRKAGYEVPIVSDGVEIVELMPGSPAEGKLRAGDIIKKVDGKNVYLAEDVVKLIQEKKIGEKVRLTVSRGEGEVRELEVATTTNPEQPQKSALRIYVRTLNWHPLFPIDIEIETGPVIGPSAGMMFVLEILDRLLPENLTSGYKIAGTGTITLDGKVGGIGGVKQKVVAAERAGADFFLIPEENYQEALRAARKIEIVAVKDLEEVLNFLQTLNNHA